MAKATAGSGEQIKRFRKEIAALKRAAKKHAAALQQSTQALSDAEARATESLEQQAATSEIPRVISSSPADVQPVFDAIVESAVRLCGGLFGAVLRFDGALLHLAAHHNVPPADTPPQGAQARMEAIAIVLASGPDTRGLTMGSASPARR